MCFKRAFYVYVEKAPQLYILLIHTGDRCRGNGKGKSLKEKEAWNLVTVISAIWDLGKLYECPGPDGFKGVEI